MCEDWRASPISSLHHTEFVCADADHVADMELASAAQLGLAVDGHLTVGDQRLCLRATLRRTRELEQLAETDHVTCDLD
jgi:hypothetical protein